MFIKQDLRKINTILLESSSDNSDGAEALRDLRLQRRKAEFQGSIKILTTPTAVPALSKLESLSIYNCNISDLSGIGCLTTLKTLNVGQNPLDTLPDDLACLTCLEELWLDDCSLKGPLPNSITKLSNLQELRASNNQITSLPEFIGFSLPHLRVLCLDRNQLRNVPESITHLVHLQSLSLRHNLLRELPEGIPGASHVDLKVLHISSNQLTRLPDSMEQTTSLTHLYANSNQLQQVPNYLLRIKHVNLAHNQIRQCNMEETAVAEHIILTGNPFTMESPRKNKSNKKRPAEAITTMLIAPVQT